MLRLRRLTDYGTVILAHLAATRETWSTVGSISQATRIPQATVGKLLKQLSHHGLVISQRGTHGGYQLARDPKAISALEILESLEGRIAVTDCSPGRGFCSHTGYCRVRTPWQTINEALRRTLVTISLAELATAMPVSVTFPLRSDPSGRDLNRSMPSVSKEPRTSSHGSLESGDSHFEHVRS
jgi:FeS assembly SUF system regulator